jgi:hypothetical protein
MHQLPAPKTPGGAAREAEQARQQTALREAGRGPEAEALLEENRAEFQAPLARLSPQVRNVIVIKYARNGSASPCTPTDPSKLW